MGTLVLSMAAALLPGCGDGGSGAATGGNAGSGGSNGTGAGTGGIGGSTDSGLGGDVGLGGGVGASGGNGHGTGGSGGAACAGETLEGQLVPLDMYILLDKSGSMMDKTSPHPGAPTKWKAVTEALTAFFTDPKSNGLGVGLQFFPVSGTDVPAVCTSDSDCGVHGPCVLRTCDNHGTIVPCSVNGDCGGGGHCVDLGQCQSTPGKYCLPVGGDCDPGPQVDPCVQLQESFCLQQDSCDPADYATPAVEIATLGGAADALSSAIALAIPIGATPTAPALQGAIDHVKEWAAAHPDHKVVAVMATDGLPTECDPLDIDPIAQIASDGQAEGVLTFVIGVFAASDANAQANLDAIAMGGGTDSAFFIASDEDVTAAFLAALQAIRGQTLACEYLIPTPPDGSDLDYGEVNVEHTPPGATMPETILYVGSEAACDPAAGGWYYDVDPAAGAPTKILMCPATCAGLTSVGGKVEIEIGCQTIVAEPK